MWKKVGSPGRARTCDILINSQALYRLSYRGMSNLNTPFSGTSGPGRERFP